VLITIGLDTLKYKSTQKQSNCKKKKVQPMQKRQHEKSCEIKGGGPEVTVVV